jgi:hypothetical protein
MALSDTWSRRDDGPTARRADGTAPSTLAAARGRRAQARRAAWLPAAAVPDEALPAAPPRRRKPPSPRLLESLPPGSLAARLLAAGADDVSLGLERLPHRLRPARRLGRAPWLLAAGLALVIAVGVSRLGPLGTAPPSAAAPAAASGDGRAGPPGTAPGPAGLRVSMRPVETNYTVQAGDTLERIAQRFGTTVEALAGLNNLPDHNSIRVGQKLIIP